MIQQHVSFELIFQSEDSLQHRKHSAPTKSPTQGHNFSLFSSALFHLPLLESPPYHITSALVRIIELPGIYLFFKNISLRQERISDDIFYVYLNSSQDFLRQKQNGSANKVYFFFVFFITLCATSSI